MPKPADVATFEVSISTRLRHGRKIWFQMPDMTVEQINTLIWVSELVLQEQISDQILATKEVYGTSFELVCKRAGSKTTKGPD